MGMSYSFADVTGTLVGPGGVVDLGHGSAVGEEGIKISMAAEGGSMTIGVDGCGMHNLNADKSGTVTIEHFETSPVNAKLQAMMNMQSQNAPCGGKTLFPLPIRYLETRLFVHPALSARNRMSSIKKTVVWFPGRLTH